MADLVKNDATRRSTRGQTLNEKPPSSDHLKVADMVQGAIKGLGERGGSSVTAIKEYICEKYNVDAEKLVIQIYQFLVSEVKKGTYEQTKGRGVSTTYKIASEDEALKATAKKPVRGKKEKKSLKIKIPIKNKSKL